MSGRFVWYELLTSDIAKAIAFYTDVVGWKTEPYGEGAEAYTMWTSGQGPLGGVMTLPEEAKKMGAPPHWGSYVEVDDVDASTEKAKSLGAKVLFGPHDIPKIGRFTLIADPQGATISLFKPIEPMRPHDTTKPGEVSWNELYAKDHGAAFKFYSQLFGWQQISEMDMGPAGKYLIYGQGDKQYGGMMTLTPEMKSPPAWAYYFNVDELDETIEKARARDAKLMVGPMDVPGGARVAILTDPQGAVFALHEPKKG
jgi:predicted enzyme related to lactoylglutathione lyase